MRTFVIGRSTYADIVLADETVAPRHAELVLSEDGRAFLTDCAMPGGTWRRANGEPGPTGWVPLRQDFVAAETSLRLGAYQCTGADLIRLAQARADSPTANGHGEGGNGRDGGTEQADDDRPAGGRVERDPDTGEIIRKRL